MPPDASGGVLPRLRALLLWLLRRTAQAEPRSLVLSLWDGGPCAAPPTGEAAAEAVALLNRSAQGSSTIKKGV